MLILQLCSIPYGHESIDVKYTLGCRAKKGGRKQDLNYNYDGMLREMSYSQSCVKWKDDLVYFVQLEGEDELEFYADIEILTKHGDDRRDTQKKPDEMDSMWNEIKKKQDEEEKRDGVLRGMIDDLREKLDWQNKRILELERNDMMNMVKYEGKKVEVDNDNEVCVWLKDIVGLKMYMRVFVENGFDDMESLSLCDMECLKGMGIKMGHRLKLMKYIKTLGDDNNDK